MKRLASLILTLMSFAAPAWSQQDIVKVGPWITNVTPQGVSILWTTSSPSTGWVETGDGTRVYDTFAGRRSFGTFHRVDMTAKGKLTYRLGGELLLDSSNPRYPVFGDSWYGRWNEARLFDPSDTSTTFSVFNDIHCAKDVFSRLSASVDESEADFIFLNGDIASAGNYSLDEFVDFEIAPMGELPSHVPVLFARGNHEGRGIGIKDVAEVFPNPNHGDHGRFYYTFRQGQAAFLVLDAGETGRERSMLYCGKPVYEDYLNEQVEWAGAALASPEFAEAPLKVCLLHVPMHEADYDGGDNLHAWLNHHFMPLLNEAGIDIMICADLHEPHEFLPGTMHNDFPIIVNDDCVRLDFRASDGVMHIVCLDPYGRVTYNADFAY